jgi:cardiolipin synthase
MPTGTSLANWLTIHELVTGVAILVYVLTTHASHPRRNPAAAIAWVLFILLMPYLALPAYLALGSRKLARRVARPAPPAPSSQQGRGAWAVGTLVALGQPAPAHYRNLHLHRTGAEARQTLLDCIDGAQHSIDIFTFILGRDGLGNAVLDALCRKAREGVRVRLLLDGVGRLMAARPDLRRLTDAGGAYALFAPPMRLPPKGHTNLRNHRKLVAVDGATDAATDGATDARRLWCGGRNLAVEYFDGTPSTPAWRDLSFDLRGPLVLQASALFERDWSFAQGSVGLPATAVDEAAATAPADADGAQLIASGPDQFDDTVYALLVTAAYRAQRRIALVTPYFVPPSALLMALCLAARRGVAVDLLVPVRSNHRLSDLARNRALRSLADAGGNVWLAPGMLHAKLAVVDDTLALAGSANLDSRSLLLNYEFMVAFHACADVGLFADWFAHECSTAQRYVAKQPGLIRDVAEGTLLWMGFQL